MPTCGCWYIAIHHSHPVPRLSNKALAYDVACKNEAFGNGMSLKCFLALNVFSQGFSNGRSGTFLKRGEQTGDGGKDLQVATMFVRSIDERSIKW